MQPPTRQNTLMTRMRSETRGRLVIRSISSTSENIIIDQTENSLRLDHAALFKTLNDLLDDRIKSAMEVQFTAMQNRFTEKMENTMN